MSYFRCDKVKFKLNFYFQFKVLFERHDPSIFGTNEFPTNITNNSQLLKEICQRKYSLYNLTISRSETS